jgi:hypothetical protein
MTMLRVKFASRPGKLILVISLLISLFSFYPRANSQEALMDLNCLRSRDAAIIDCTPTIDCSPAVDTRSCNTCLVSSGGGKCLIRGNDPTCEAMKATQNQLYSAAKAACEAQKAAAKLRCEATKAKTTMESNACVENKTYDVFIHAGQTPPNGLTSSIIDALREQGYTVHSNIEPDTSGQSGPGVEYFDDAAAGAANTVANIVNSIFAKLNIARDDSERLKARRVSNNNPPRFLGVWLF